MTPRRFAVAVRWRDDHALVESHGGYRTRADAERIADAKRRTIETQGWNMTVEVTEA